MSPFQPRRCRAFAVSFTACRWVPTCDMQRFRFGFLSGSDGLNWRAACRSMHYIEQYAPSQDASRGIRL
jgi:hypothetical protein